MSLEQKINILLVDDCPDNLLALETILNSLEQNLVKAQSGEEALKCLSQQEFALILLDVKMPGIDGLETAKLIRQQHRNQHTPIVLFTATNPTSDFILKGYSVGAVDYLIKPFVPEILLLKVRVFVELFNKTREVKQQAENLQIINQELQRQIAERQKAEEALQWRKQELKTLLANVPDVIARYDRQLRHIYVNSASKQVSGIPPEEFIGKTLSDMSFPEEQVILWEASIKKVFATGELDLLEYNYLGVKGSKYYESRVVPELAPDGSVEFVLTITRDITQLKQAEKGQQKAKENLEIQVQERTAELNLSNKALQAEITERKQIEKELRESEQRLRGIFNQAAVGIAQLGIDGEWLFVNQKVCDIVGYTREELLGLTFQDITYPDDLETDLEYVQQILAGEIYTYSMEKRYIRKDGSLVWINLSVSLVRDLSGEPKYFISIIEDINERKKTQEKLYRSEQRYRSLVTATAQFVWTTNAKGEVIEDSPTWRIMTGQTWEEFQGWGWLNVVHPDDRDCASRLWIQALETKTIYETEYQIRMKDGSYRDFWVRGVPVLEVDGSIREWVGICIDITERKQAQEALKESESQMRLALEAAEMGTWSVNLITNVLRESERIGIMFGLPPGQVNFSFEDWCSRVHPDDLERLLAEFNQAIAGEREYNTQYRVVWPDGTIRWLATIGKILRDEAGKPLSAVGIAMDITNRILIQEELEKSYNLLQNVIEGMVDPIFLKDLQGRYILLNSTAARIIGRHKQEIIGKDDTEFFPSEIARPLMETDQRLMTTGETQTIEEYVPTNGIMRTFLSTKNAWRDAQGNIIGLIGIAKDISERKLAEQEIINLNENLERRVFERTAELEATNKELEAFSYSVSHDLRAPLRAIDGFSQALVDRYTDKLDDKGKHYLQRIRTGTQRMGELIDDLLTLSRVTRSEMRRTQVDLSALAKEIIATLQYTQPDRLVEIAIAPGLVATGDLRLLRVVLENLLNNAWKFTSAKLHTKIEFGAILQQDAKVAYFVRDNGAGFDMAYSNKLFGAFQRLHTVNDFPGTGIGLATVQRIIHRHGGRVWAEGVVEEGATFYFTL